MTSPLYTLTTVHDVPTSTTGLRHPPSPSDSSRYACMGCADANRHDMRIRPAAKDRERGRGGEERAGDNGMQRQIFFSAAG